MAASYVCEACSYTIMMVPAAYHDGVGVKVCDLAADRDGESDKLL